MALSEPLKLTSKVIELDPSQAGRTHVSSMKYMGGLILTADDARFGGWFGIEVAADGTHCWAVSDQGSWMKAELKYDDAGRLSGTGAAEIARLNDVLGAKLYAKWYSDAEDLIRVSEDRVLVSFEHAHRVWSYKMKKGQLVGAAKPLAIPNWVQRAPQNGGIEAMTLLSDGRVLMIAERLRNENNDFAGFIVNLKTNKSKALFMVHHTEFEPTAMTTLAHGDLLVLERRYVPEGDQLFGRIRLVSKDSIRANSLLVGKEMALFALPMTVDNFEGMTSRSTKSGKSRVYLMSDNNFKPSQRTLLLQMEMGR